MRNRYYDPELGRFISADPLGYVDGPSTYGLAAGNPLNNRDPLGLELVQNYLTPSERAEAHTRYQGLLERRQMRCESEGPMSEACLDDLRRAAVVSFGDKHAEVIRFEEGLSGSPIVYVNGVLTPYLRAYGTGEEIVDVYGRPVYVVWNPTTQSTKGDAEELFLVDKLGIAHESTKKFVTTIRRLLEPSKCQPNLGGKIT